jgi:hypothetical protein
MVDVMFQTLSRRLRDLWKPTRGARASRAYRCQCGRPVFFRNSQCLACGAPLGYLPEAGALVPLEPAGEAGLWRLFGGGDEAPAWRRCANFGSAACNWMVGAGDAHALCRSCRLNRVIPDLSLPANVLAWTHIELAKRRLVSQLLALGLPLKPKSDDEAQGLAFDFLAPTPAAPRVMTGHADGVITLNIEEADDATRERIRAAMREPYRTLLGHFRHEVGHYYWDRLVRDAGWLAPFRELFGDEQQDYAAALKANYEQGPPADWPQRFVSAYASMHPWEDWAETWAHYLHIRDTFDTALSFGIQARAQDRRAQPFARDDLWHPDDPGAERFLDLLHSWIGITAVMNEMSAAMGHQDYYPFVLPRAAVAKLHFIHCVVSQARQDGLALAASAAVRAPRRRASGPQAQEGVHGAH